MNKLFTTSLLITSLGFLGTKANAQISNGGIPFSNTQNIIENTKNNVFNLTETWEEHQTAYYAESPNKPFIIAQGVDIDVKYPESGTFTYLNDGSIVWQTAITVPTAPALGIYMDKFQLPKGVNMYVKSKNGRQILGAYTQENNSPDQIFAIEACLGETAIIEFNIAPGINANDIVFNANKAMVYRESIEYLKEYLTDEEVQVLVNTGTDADPYNLTGRGSVCFIDANCSIGDSHPLSKKAAVQTLTVVNNSIGMCSATLINNTSNSSTNCTPLLFLASHCESSGLGWANTNYSNLLVRFNFQRPECNSTSVAKQNTITGMNFKSRSEYTAGMNANDIGDDFLLLQFRINIPERFEAVMAGWDLSTQPVNPPSGQKYIGFHHPAGDTKKVTFASKLTPSNNLFYTLDIENSRTNGAYAPGSSGSGLFREDGIVLGTASTGSEYSNAPANCKLNSTNGAAIYMERINYYRLSQGWDFDPAPNKQLKIWLDPTNTGVTKLGPTSARCQEITNLSVTKINTLENNVSIYPNPSSNGVVNVKFNLQDQEDVTIELYDITGKKVFVKEMANVTNNNVAFNVSELNNGMYLVKINNKSHSVTKKITIAK